MQPAIASMVVCGTIVVWFKHIAYDLGSLLLDTSVLQSLGLLPMTLWYCMDGLGDKLGENVQTWPFFCSCARFFGLNTGLLNQPVKSASSFYALYWLMFLLVNI